MTEKLQTVNLPAIQAGPWEYRFVDAEEHSENALYHQGALVVWGSDPSSLDKAADALQTLACKVRQALRNQREAGAVAGQVSKSRPDEVRQAEITTICFREDGCPDGVPDQRLGFVVLGTKDCFGFWGQDAPN